MSPPVSLRRELLVSLFVLFGGALALAVAALFVVQPFMVGPGDALFFAGVLVAADLAILFLFARTLLQRRLLEPLRVMVDDARRIEAEDYRHRMTLGGSEELDTLAESVNAMAERLIRNQEMLTRNIESLDETNRELVSARDEVVRAARLASVGTLAAGMAHEVGNPLGAVIGYLDIARRRAETGGEVEEILDSATRESRRIDRIIRSLLSYARPRPEVHGAVVPADVVERVRRLLEAQGRFAGMEVSWDVPDTLPGVEVDPHHLEQVLVNLLLNAVDAMDAMEPGHPRRIEVLGREEPWTPPVVPFRREGDPPGPTTRTGGAWRMELGGARKRLTGAAAGRGPHGARFGSGHPPRAGRPGLRPLLHHEGAGQGNGAGTGHLLAAGRGNGGAHRPRVRRGGGGGLPGHPPHRARVARTHIGWEEGPLRILVIDDEQALRHSLTLILRDAGYQVLEAASGSEGLRMLREVRPDMVLCDIRMPGMGGLEFLAEATAGGTDALILMMTAYGGIETAIEAMKAGAYDYLPKPFGADEVLLTIKKAEEREQLRREVGRLREEVRSDRRFGDIVARSPAMIRALELATRVAPIPRRC
jgi:CheY-like chemotaxis protein/HAMP domain-containing protein